MKIKEYHYSGTVVHRGKRRVSGVHDLTSERYGSLVVVEYLGMKDEYRSRLWGCICDCGEKTAVTRRQLKANKGKCGCWRRSVAARGKDKRLPYGESAFNGLYSSYKSQAKRRGIEFGLSKDEFRELTQRDCRYCGEGPSACAKTKVDNGNYIYTGIDRVDSSIGYILGNVQPCCKRCNFMKGKMAEDDFLNHVLQIVEHSTPYTLY